MSGIKILCISTLIFVSSFNVSWADNDSYEKAMSLYSRGDWISAMSHFEKAAQGGVVEAQRRLGYILWKGGTDEERAERWLRAAAVADDKEAQGYYLSFLSEHSLTKIGRVAAARDWLAEQSLLDVKAKLVLARSFEGDDDAQALRLYQELVDAGNAEAVWRLMGAYRNGELGVAVDLARVEALEALLK